MMKISPHSAFPNSFKDHMQREWDARDDKLKEAHELLAIFKIDSILSLEPSQIEDIVHLMITNPDLERIQATTKITNYSAREKSCRTCNGKI